MNHLFKHCFAASVLGLATWGVHAQVVYRCGNTYAQAPCAQGRAVDVSDPRSEAQQADARRVAAEERRLAAEMASDRRAEQAAVKPLVVRVAGKARPHVASTDSLPLKPTKASRKPAASTDFIAQVPSSHQRRARS